MQSPSSLNTTDRIRVYWRDLTYKTVRLYPATTCLDVCKFAARNTKVESHYQHLTIYVKTGFDTSLYKAPEVMLDHSDIMAELIKKWGSEVNNYKFIIALRKDSARRISRKLSLRLVPIREAQLDKKSLSNMSNPSPHCDELQFLPPPNLSLLPPPFFPPPTTAKFPNFFPPNRNLTFEDTLLPPPPPPPLDDVDGVVDILESSNTAYDLDEIGVDHQFAKLANA